MSEQADSTDKREKICLHVAKSGNDRQQVYLWNAQGEIMAKLKKLHFPSILE
jgi:hypothetical protein